MNERQETFYTARQPANETRRASIDTVSSAADRRRWRNHAHVLTPEPQHIERDPFDDFAVNLPPSTRKNSNEKSDESSDEAIEEGIDPRIGHQGPRTDATLGGNGNVLGPDEGEAEKEALPESEQPTVPDRRHTRLPWRERIRHFTWTWFCLTMATGGIANVLYAVPFRFPYPLLIIGPHAGTLAPKVSNPDTALQIILGGYVIQGIGFLVSLMIYAAFIYRLMTQKLPKESLRPGMFISVGPSGFTIAGVVTMGQELPRVVPSDFMGEGNGELAGRVGMIMANFMGLWLWGLALWFFFQSVGKCERIRRADKVTDGRWTKKETMELHGKWRRKMRMSTAL
ncbi:hypothetical protein N0V86_002607 [Didymella sp. IMI 355093]|nr:hypothetical protein N0V86_002607 [Didymella sp. IMI 355093]